MYMFRWIFSLVLISPIVECRDWNSFINWETCNHRTSLARSVKESARNAACKLPPASQSALETLAASLSLSFDQLGMMTAAAICADHAHDAEDSAMKDYLEKLAGFYIDIATNPVRPYTEIFRFLSIGYETNYDLIFGSRWQGYRNLLALVAVSHHPEVPDLVKDLAMKVFLNLLSPLRKPLIGECNIAHDYSDLLVRLVPSESIPDYPSISSELDQMNSRMLECVADEITL